MKKRIIFSDKCESKKKFTSNKQAEERAKEIESESGNMLYHYKCHVCDGWHLTKRTKKDRKIIKKIIKIKQNELTKQYNREIEMEADFWINKKNW